jgi:hypothetical protein
MYRLIYKSHSKTPIDLKVVNSILESSQKNNTESDISGALLATKRHFLQILEGSFEDVNKLYSTIVQDPRHDEVQLISFTCIENRIFESWAMHGIGVFNLNHELSQQLKKSYGEENGEARFPTEEWKVLAMIHDIRRATGK